MAKFIAAMKTAISCVFAASKEKKLLSMTNLGAPVYSTPVVANGVLYVHSNTHLFAFCNSEHKRRPATDQKSTLRLIRRNREMKNLLLFLLIAVVYVAHPGLLELDTSAIRWCLVSCPSAWPIMPVIPSSRPF